MDHFKSWWILPASLRYPPPSLPGPEDEGIGQATGPICPGHFIPTKRKHWNNIINRNGPLEYPRRMPLLHSEQWDVSYQVDGGHDVEFSARVGTPIAGPLGGNVNAGARAAFEESVTNYRNFDKLDTYMVQPWYKYIQDSLKDEDIDRYIQKHTSRVRGKWEVFMISGIIVARGATMNSTVSQIRTAESRGEVGIQGVAEVSLGGNSSTDDNTSTSVGGMSDFVWAIQITRVHKDGRHKDWEFETLWNEKVKGSVLTLDGQAEAKQRFERARTSSEDAGIANASVFGLEAGDDIFILPAEGSGVDSGSTTPETSDTEE